MRLLDWRVVGQLFLKASSLQRKRATLTVAAMVGMRKLMPTLKKIYG